MKRRTIKTKLQNMVLLISIAAVLTTSIIGIISMVIIQMDSESALITQMEKMLVNLAEDRSNLAESELSVFSEIVENFSGYINRLYRHPDFFVSRDVQPPKKENAGIYIMQRGLRDKDVKLEAVHRELYLLGNIEQIWAPVLINNRNIITTIYLGTESGLMIAYDNQSEISAEDGNDIYYDYSKSAWYQLVKERGRICFTEIYMDIYKRGLMITCTAPFYDEENNFAGAVGMDILISDLYREIVDVDLGDDENAYAFLVDNTGKIITPVEEKDALSTEYLFEEEGINEHIVSEILSGKSGVSEINVNDIYYAYAPIKSTGWKFCIKIPEHVILSPVLSVNRDIVLTILSFVVIFLAIIILTAEVARRFSARLIKPLVILAKDVKKISGGNLDYRTEIQENDEIGDLATSFNDMAVNLKDYIKNLAEVTAEKERIGAELNVATQIQADMLPRVFPPFPERNEFEIYASMTPAKEVGGDFYDFFLIDNDHLGLVIADVSGKGVPAALFMVIAKTLIKNRALMGGSPSEILRDVNTQLCEGNESDLFVTTWLGILEISTGKMKASNAGHEYPAIRRKKGSYELLKTKQSPAVATMEGLKFREIEIELNPGDNVFVYTDGVAEATNSNNELLGTDRMLEALNETQGKTAEEILVTMKKVVDDFTGDAPQFDDVTMLCLRYFGGENFMKELTIDADVKNLDEVLEFVDKQLEIHDCPLKIQTQLDIAVEELFVNIAHYAYKETGKATVRVEIVEEPLSVVITFIDNGVPYDPLKKPDPDITLSAEERQIGGLGIYIVKKSMDDVVYKYDEGKNILTIKKKLEETV